MKMEQFNHNKTPLGEKFDSADFSIEPHAWDDMEKLLAVENKPESAPLSIGGNKMLFLIALAGLGLLWRGESGSSIEKIGANPSIISARIQTSAINSVDAITNTVVIFNQNQGFAANKSVNKAELFTFLTVNSERQEEKKSENLQFLESDSQQKLGFATNQALSKEIKKDNSKKINALNRSSELAKNTSNSESLSEQSASLPPQYFEQKTDFQAEKWSKNDEKRGEDVSKNNELNKETSSQNGVQESEKQENLPNNDVQNTAFFPLDLLTPNYVYPETDYNASHYEILKSLSEGKLIPISKLVKGARHQLEIGLGTATYDAPKYINHLRIGYQYRLTPLFGVGSSVNYSVKKDEDAISGGVFTGELEGLLYFANRRKTDFIVSAGYGYRQWKNLDNKEGKAKGFTLGFVFQYRINNQWIAGLRLDIKEFGSSYQDPAIVLTLGKKF